MSSESVLKTDSTNLEKLDSFTKEKIRIFSSEEGIRKSVPENMKNNCFEYDERLNPAKDSVEQGAIFHIDPWHIFPKKVYKDISPKKSTQQLRTDVAKLMSLLEKPTLVGSKENGKRVRKSNEEIKKWIEKTGKIVKEDVQFYYLDIEKQKALPVSNQGFQNYGDK